MLISFESLSEVRERHADEDIVLAIGAYDLLHEGHAQGLMYRKSLGEILVVGIVTDEQLARRNKSHRPARSEMARAVLVDMLKPVDYTYLLPTVVKGGPSAAIQTVEALRPNIFTDLAEEGFWTREREQIESMGVRFVYDPLEKVNSSSAIKQRIIDLAIEAIS